MKQECNNCIHWRSKESYRADSFTYAPCDLTNRGVPDFHTCEKWDRIIEEEAV